MDTEGNATVDVEVVREALSHAQQVVLALAPKLTAVVSLSGSCIVVAQSIKSLRADGAYRKRKSFVQWFRSKGNRNEQEDRSSRQRKSRKGAADRGRRGSISSKLNNKARPRAYKTFVMGMSLVDIVTSAAWFCSTWLVPDISADISSTYNISSMYGAIGNQVTCSAQGFLGTLSMTSVIYNACLALYYFLIIGKNWNETRIQEIQQPFHCVAVGCGLAVSIIAACLKMYNPIGWACWIAAYPPGCVESWRAYLTNASPTCVRGDNATILLWAGFYGPVWLAITFSSISMGLVYWSVHKTELKSAQHMFCPADGEEGNGLAVRNEGVFGRRSSLVISSGRDIEAGINSTAACLHDRASNSVVDNSLQRRRSSLLLQLIQHSRRSVTRSMSEDIADERMAVTIARRQAEVEHGAPSVNEVPCESTIPLSDVGKECGLLIPNPVKEECSTADDVDSSGRKEVDDPRLPSLRRHASAPSSRSVCADEQPGNAATSPKLKRFSLQLNGCSGSKGDDNKITRMAKRASWKFAGAASVCESRASAATRRAAACRKTKKVANQAMLFVGALYLTWTLPTIHSAVVTSGRMSYALLLLQALLMPTQGLLNFAMYIRPMFLRCRKKFNTLSRGQIFCLLVRGKDDQYMKHLHKENIKKQRKAQQFRERRRARPGRRSTQTKEKTKWWRSLLPGVPRTIRGTHHLERQSSKRSKSSFDPSLSVRGGGGGGADSRNGRSKASGMSSNPSFNSRNRRREKLVKKWQSNYNNYPGRHRHGLRPNGQVQAAPEPLDSDEERDLWQINQAQADREESGKPRPPRLRFSLQTDVMPPAAPL